MECLKLLRTLGVTANVYRSNLAALTTSVKHIGFILFLLFLSISALPQKPAFIENLGQWDEQITYHLPGGSGGFWLEQNGWTISRLDPAAHSEAMHEVHDHGTTDIVVNGHAIKARFLNANPNPNRKSELKQKAYLNYFLGNDQSKWKGHVGRYNRVVYESIYDGVDLQVDLEDYQPKLTYVVEPNSDPSLIQIEYFGQRSIRIRNNQLVLSTTVGDIVEQALLAFQMINGQPVQVDCRFALKNNIVSFEVGEYDAQQALYIDPTIIASTNSGCTFEAWGHSSTYTLDGEIYSAGRCFVGGYPVDTGAFQYTYVGASVTGSGATAYYQRHDICISKYNSNGSELLYASYLGGDGQEAPHSIITNASGELFLLGSSNASDFPTTSNAYDTSHNGGRDVVVCRISSDGSQLMASTYIGGSGMDGLDSAAAYLTFYADDFRGEIVLDSSEFVYVSSFTRSANFPTTAGVFQDSLNGLTDGVVFKMNADLDQLIWSTYLGGSLQDGAYALKVSADKGVYVAGYTRSSDFPVDTAGAFPTYMGGTKDGFVVKLDSNAQALQHGSFFGTTSQDQNYLIELDVDGNVYLFGTSNGVVAATSGRYSGPTLGSFIYKTTSELDSVLWVSSFGRMAPAAFLVDLCNRIYISGQAATGLELQLTQFDTLLPVLNLNSGGFYLMKLSPEAVELEFGSFFGNDSSHVDGGTSRFDKRGVIYQATCSPGTFTTTSWAYSPNNVTTNNWQSGNTYDNTAFKIDFDQNIAKALAGPSDTVCAPIEIQFNNSGSVGEVHHWDFGDGTTSNDSTPTHIYDSVGVYEVFYLVGDSQGCYAEDTAFLEINVLEPVKPEIQIGDTHCVDSVKLSIDTSQFTAFLWESGQTTSEIYVNQAGLYSVSATANLFCVNSDTVPVSFFPDYHFSLNDTGICELGFSVHAPPSAQTFLWSTGDTTASTLVTNTGTYSLTASNGFCDDVASMQVNLSFVEFDKTDTVTCDEFLELSVNESGGSTEWSTGETTPQIQVTESGVYWATVSNGFCLSSDTISVTFNPELFELGPDQIVCDPTAINAPMGFDRYQWQTGDTSISINIDSTASVWLKVWDGECTDIDTLKIEIQQLIFQDPISVLCNVDSTLIEAPYWNGIRSEWFNGDSTESTWVYSSGDYWISMNTDYCSNIDTIHIEIIHSPEFTLGADTAICVGETLQINADTIFGDYAWSTGDTGSQVTLLHGGVVWASQDYRGCVTYDTIEVEMRQLWSDSFSLINNVMTPNGDGLNEELKFHVGEESLFHTFNLKVYNRWGLKMFETDDFHEGWNGLDPSGDPAAEGTYFYIMESHTKCVQREKIVVMDNVTLFR